MRKTAWFMIFTLSAMLFIIPKKNENNKTPRPQHPARVVSRINYPVEQVVKIKQAAPKAEQEFLTLLDQHKLGKEASLKLDGLPRGMRYLPHIKAITSDDYNLDLGPALMVKDGLTFYRTRGRSPAIEMASNVVYNQRKNTFHPMSSTLKLSGVTPDLKEKIVQGKLAEHYYNEELQILYLSSSNAELLDDYKHLAEEGLPVGLEVVEGVYRTK